MKRNRIFAFLLAGVLLFACGCSANSSGFSLLSHKKTVELTEKGVSYWAQYVEHQEVGKPTDVVEQKEELSYLLQYPTFEKAGIDARISEIVAEIRNAFDAEFTPQAEETQKKQPSATLYLGYEAYLAKETQLSVVFFETHEADGVLSPHTRIQIFHFDLEKDTEVTAESLTWNGFAKNAASYAEGYFISTEPYKNSIFGNYKTLLAADAGRFERFALTKDGVLFYFDRYDLFPGSFGVVRLTVPYAQMQKKAEEPKKEKPVPKAIRNKKMVALTYDDGPNPKATNAILDVLEKYNARATFFDLGSLVERYPDVVKREEALGCEVGSHSYNHKNFNKLTDAEIKADVQKTAAAFRKALGREPAVFRPPYGNCKDSVKKQIPMSIYLWSVDTLDWKSRDAKAVVNVVKNAGNLDGKVILMHSIYGSTAEATATLVPYLQKQGYALVTVSELVEAKHGEKPQKNKLYGYSYFK